MIIDVNVFDALTVQYYRNEDQCHLKVILFLIQDVFEFESQSLGKNSPFFTQIIDFACCLINFDNVML